MYMYIITKKFYIMDKIAVKLMYYQNMIKLYHWHTPSHARHVASDSLFGVLVENIDKLMEQFQGSRGSRLTLTKDRTIILQNLTDDDAVKLLTDLKKFLSTGIDFHKDETDLMNTRDEILGAVNKTLYLFTFE